MPLYRDEGVILRTHKLGEADRILTILTRSHGKVRAVAKGVRRTASKFGARLEPFMVADIQFYQGKSLDTVNQAETVGSYGIAIAGDMDLYRSASVMVETADRITDSEPAEQQFLLLHGALRALARGDHAVILTLHSYLLRALSLAGWAPSFEACARCGTPGPHLAFALPLGGLVCDGCAPTGAARLERGVVDLLDALLSGEWPRAEAASAEARASASGVVAAYTQFHLERGLRSLEHVI
jgi:DNA repair protein RecO (recombination protein O)